MTFGRWLLVHSFSIFLVCLLLLGYVYRDELKLEQAYQQLLNFDSEEQVAVDSAKSDEITPSSEPVIENKDRQLTTESAPKAEISESFTQPSMELQTKPTVSEVIIEQDALLFQARQAYWDKNYEQAIQGYQQLIQKEPNNPDYFGELGNIYYSLNDFPNASRHYYQAALVLIQQNKMEQARSLVSPVTAMNRELGDKLRQRMAQ